MSPARAILLGLAALAAPAGLAQPVHLNLGERPESRPAEVIPHLRVDAALALVPVHVTTSAGMPVTGLERSDFRILVDGAEQPVTYLVRDDAPISIGLVFDTSGSMQHKLRKAAEAAAAFFKTATLEDEFFLVEFSERPKLAVPFTADSGELFQRIARAYAHGRTSLFDAVYLGLEQMKQARHPRRAMIVLSDGGDNRSRHTFKQVENALLESEVQIYAMGVFDSMGEGRRVSREEREGPQLLERLAQQSGGRHFPVPGMDQLPAIAERVGEELRNQYLVGFAPPDGGRDGKYHRVQVVVTPREGQPRLRVEHRPGYRAPSE